MPASDHEQARKEARKNAKQAVKDALRDHGSASPEYRQAQAWLNSTKRRG